MNSSCSLEFYLFKKISVYINVLINSINRKVQESVDDAPFLKIYLEVCHYLCHLLATRELMEVGHLFLADEILIVYFHAYCN